MTFSVTSSAMRLIRVDLVDLVGDFGGDDGLASAGDLLDGAFGAHHEAAAAGAVGLGDVGAAVEVTAGGEVWAEDMLEGDVEVGAGVAFFLGEDGDGSVDDLGEVVGRDVGGHADGRCR